MVFGSLHRWCVVGFRVFAHGAANVCRLTAVASVFGALFMSSAVPNAAQAAQNGRLGASSTGSIGISMVKPQSISVQSRDAAALTVTSAETARGTVSQCVNANLFGGGYSVSGASQTSGAVSVAVRPAGVTAGTSRCPGGTVYRFAVDMQNRSGAPAAGVVSLTYAPE